MQFTNYRSFSNYGQQQKCMGMCILLEIARISKACPQSWCIMSTITIKNVIVPANKVQVGHVVDNRNSLEPLVVLSVKGFCDHGKNTYKIAVGRNDVTCYELELQDSHVLTYTYEVGA